MIRKRRQRPAFSLAAWAFPAFTLLIANLHGSQATAAFSWEAMDALRASIVEPTFPDREFLVTDYGAAPDGRTDSTRAFREAIQACAAAGGGRVVARGGVFKTGAIHLKSGVNLHVAEGATLSFFTDPAKFLPGVLTRYEGVELINYSPLVYAYGQKNVALTGKGILDGNAGEDNWWKMTPPRSRNEDPATPHSRTILFQMAEDGVPVKERDFGRKSQLRPTFVEFYECENILVEDVTITNAPFWMIHPVLSRNITIRGVTCDSSGPNNDGVDPESSENVLIEKCVFHTKDDGVAIKAGRNADGRRVNRLSRNIIITDCVMNTRHTAVAIGSEMTGGVENVYAQNLVCGEIQRAFRIKTNSMRGGFVRHIGMRNVQVREATGTLIDFHTSYGRETGPFYPVVEDIALEDISCDLAEQAISFNGSENMPIRGARLERIQVAAVRKPSRFHHVQDLTQEAVEIGQPRAAATLSGGRLAALLYHFEEGGRDGAPAVPVVLESSGLAGLGQLKWQTTPLGEHRNNSHTRWVEAGRPASATVTPEMAERFNRLERDASGVVPVESGRAVLELFLPADSLVPVDATLD